MASVIKNQKRVDKIAAKNKSVKKSKKTVELKKVYKRSYRTKLDKHDTTWFGTVGADYV